MKTEPTDIDREAARLFAPAPGMRVWTRHAKGRLVDHDGKYGTVTGEGSWEAMAVVLAIDTDDPATVGCMLAQVMAADTSDPRVFEAFYHSHADTRPPTGRGWTVTIGDLHNCGIDGRIGAALVDTMAALKGVTPPG